MPAIFVNPINEYQLNFLKDLNNQNLDLRVFISDNQPKEFIDLVPGKKAIGDIKDDSHISTACHGAFCAIYFENDIKNLRDIFINSINNSTTNRIIWISEFEPSDEILKIMNLTYVLIDSNTDYANTILELENAENLDKNIVNLKRV